MEEKRRVEEQEETTGKNKTKKRERKKRRNEAQKNSQRSSQLRGDFVRRFPLPSFLSERRKERNEESSTSFPPRLENTSESLAVRDGVRRLEPKFNWRRGGGARKKQRKKKNLR